MKNISVIILAAGEGRRMKSEKSKVLCNVLFKPMINWVVDSCKNIGCKEEEVIGMIKDTPDGQGQEKTPLV